MCSEGIGLSEAISLALVWSDRCGKVNLYLQKKVRVNVGKAISLSLIWCDRSKKVISISRGQPEMSVDNVQLL